MKDGIRSPHSDSESIRIRAAQVRLLYRQGAVGVVAALFMAICFTAVLWNHASHATLAAWLACSAVVYVARLGLVRAFEKVSPEDADTFRWGTWFAVGNAITGLLWGSIAIIILPHVSLTHQNMICFFLGAIILGTITVYFPRIEVFAPFALAVCLPLGGRLILQGGSVHVTMGIMVLLFVLVVLVAGYRMHNNLVASLKLRFENQNLIRSLMQEKTAIGQLNESLRWEIAERELMEQTLRQSEERFRELAELLPVFIFEFDEKGIFTFLNRSGLELGGYTAEEVTRGLSISEVVIEQDRERVAQNARRVLSGEFLRGEQYTILKKNGGIAPIETWSIPIVDDHTIVGVRGVGVDITDRKKAEDHIKASLREKEVLLREIHHRVKNNLAAIISLLAMRSHYSTDQATQEAFQECQDRIRSMSLAHETLYRSENLADLSARQYVDTLLAYLESSLGIIGKAIDLRKEVKNVSFDIDTAILLGFILTELVTNSFKHAFPNRKEGCIKVLLESVGEEEFELVVADDGVGMTSEVDLENPQSLGLELVGLFVEQLKGKLDISRENGTEVRVRFKELKKRQRFDLPQESFDLPK